MAITTIYTGDDIAIPVTLKVDGVVRAVDLTATVKAVLLRGATKIAPSTYWTCLSNDSGKGPSGATVSADWPNGVVLVKMAAADTASITAGTRQCQIEIQITKDSLKQRFRSNIGDALDLFKGAIS